LCHALSYSYAGLVATKSALIRTPPLHHRQREAVDETLEDSARHHHVFLLVALAQSYQQSSAIVLGLCSILLSSLAYTVLEDVITTSESDTYDATTGHVAVDGTSSLRRVSTSAGQMNVVMRNLSATIALGCAVASMLLERHRLHGLTYRQELTGLIGEDWRRDMRRMDFGQRVSMGLVGGLERGSDCFVVSRKTSMRITFKLMPMCTVVQYAGSHVFSLHAC
jgi:hypothetical protein